MDRGGQELRRRRQDRDVHRPHRGQRLGADGVPHAVLPRAGRGGCRLLAARVQRHRPRRPGRRDRRGGPPEVPRMVPRRSDRPRCRRRHPHGRGQDPDPGLRGEGAPHRDIPRWGGEVGRGDLLRRQGAHDRRGRTNVRPDLRPLVGTGRAGAVHRREGDRDVRPCADGTVEGQGGLRDNLRRPLWRHRHRPEDRGDPLHRDP